MLDISEEVVTRLGFPQFLNGVADFSASLDVTSVANANLLATSAMSGASGMTATITIGNEFISTLTAEVNMVVLTNVSNAAASLVAGQSNMTATSSRIFFTELEMSAEANMTALVRSVIITVPRPLSEAVNLSASLYEPLNVLDLPTVQYTYTEDRLLRRYSITSGRSLVINGTNGVIEDFVAQQETLDADYYFAGGHRHVLSPEEVTAVTNAGYANLITIETL